MTEFDRLLEEAYVAGYNRAWGGTGKTFSFGEWRARLGDRNS